MEQASSYLTFRKKEMKCFSLFPLLSLAGIATAVPQNGWQNYTRISLSTHRSKVHALTTSSPIIATAPPAVPTSIGVIVYPGFEALDVFGPLQAFNLLANNVTMNLSVIASSLEPVSIHGISPNGVGSTFGQDIVPTHTYEDAPPLDMLLVPGGAVTAEVASVAKAVDFVATRYQSLQYIMSVCTGARILARAAILDGKSATTKKALFDEISAESPQVSWSTGARWVVDGNIWTVANASVGMDAALAFIGEIYGADQAQAITTYMEYDEDADLVDDSFAGAWNVSSAYV